MQTKRGYAFVQVDVFTDRLFGGNPLAVFLDARGLTDGEMLSIAKEMNLSETTFVLPPTRPDCAARVRIFTPSRELPFAGHPTLGTAFVLAQRGMLPADRREIALEEGVGPIAILLEGDDSRVPAFLWMRPRDPVFGPPFPNRAAFAAALGLTEGDLLPDAPIQTGSSGSAFLFVPLRDRETVDRAVLDVPAMLRCFDDMTAVGVFVFAPDPDPTRGRVYSRMFAPHTSGIPEDPGTGSATGPLAAYLAERGAVAPDANGAVRFVSQQGVKMGRPCDLYARLQLVAGRATGIEIGGSVVPILDGTLWLP